MPNALKVSRGQDYISHVACNASTSSVAYAFTPLDIGTPGNAASAKNVIFAEEILIQNLDATNNAFIRFAAAVNTAYINSAFPAIYGASGTLYEVDTTKFIAATVTDILIPAGVRNMQVYIKALGFTVICSAGTPLLDIAAFGSLGPIS